MFKQVCLKDENLKNGILELVNSSAIKPIAGLESVTLTAIKDEALPALAYCIAAGADNQVSLRYGSTASFYAAIGKMAALGAENCSALPSSQRLGFMLDCSRNAVVNLVSAKKLITTLALSGYNYLQLYTEDTFEVEGEPYFGYLRGRLTKAEIGQIVQYGEMFGIELVPCIQTLAHLNAIFKWDVYDDINDIDDILLADHQKTYDLIEKMIAAMASVYKSKHIMIGMDEAHKLGRGKFFDKFGVVEKSDIMLKHLSRVVEICAKYNFAPQMWGDMFFRIAFNKYYEPDINASFAQEVINLVPKNLQLVYWDYYNFDPKLYDNMLRLFKSLGGSNVSFAGGLWKWTGYSPHISLSEQVVNVSAPCVNAAGVTDIMLTAWGDNGAECSLFNILSTAIYAAQLILTARQDNKFVDCLSMALLGYTHNEFKQMEQCNLLSSAKETSNISKQVFYSDILLGVFDKKIKLDYAKRYKQIARKLKILAQRESSYSYLFNTLQIFCQCLADKCELATTLRLAYKDNNTALISKLVNKNLTTLIGNINLFTDAVTYQWLKENKVFGLDVLHIRLGALKQRAQFAKQRITNYLENKISNIEELEQEILNYFSGDDNSYMLNLWQQIATVNAL